jgi:hypothetical protein
MKVKAQKTTGTTARVYSLSYQLINSVTADHFKALMRVSKYDSATKTGLVPARNEKEFLSLVAKIEASDIEEAKASHAKAAAKKTAKRMSFNDYCEDCLGTKPALMSKEEIAEARASYNKI